MLDFLDRTPFIVQVAILATLAPSVIALVARWRGTVPREEWAAAIAILPVVVAIDGWWETWSILMPQHGVEHIDGRSIAFLRATIGLVVAGPVVAFAGIATGVVHPPMRSTAWAAVPGAVALSVVGIETYSRLHALAQVAPTAKLASWSAGEPLHGALVLLVAVVCVAMASRRSGWASLVAFAPVLPLLSWPGLWIWYQIGLAETP